MNMNPTETLAFRFWRSKFALLVSSLVFLLFLILAAYDENKTEWRVHQTTYAMLLAQQSASADDAAQSSYRVEVRQIYLEGLGRIDRCITCHAAIDDPAFKNRLQPLAAHPTQPVDILKYHPSDKFGCTICHQGQGRATVKADAHGRIPHWPEPMLEGKMVYTSCSKCHYENDLYAGQMDLYGQATPKRPSELTGRVS